MLRLHRPLPKRQNEQKMHWVIIRKCFPKLWNVGIISSFLVICSTTPEEGEQIERACEATSAR